MNEPRRLYRRNGFYVYAGDDLVTGIVRLYRDQAGLKITRFIRSDGGNFVDLFGSKGVLTVVVRDRTDTVARAYQIAYNDVSWDPLHLCTMRDVPAEEAVVLTTTGDWVMAELDEKHVWVVALGDEEMDPPPASKLVKKPRKKSARGKKK